MRSAIGLGDLLRAWRAIGGDAAALRDVARLFAIMPIAPPVAAAPVVAAAAVLPEPVPASSAVRAPPAIEPAPVPPAPTAPTAPLDKLRAVELPPVAPELPMWWTGEQLPPPGGAPRKPAASLFAAPRERALLAAATRTVRADGEVDIEQLIDHLARWSLPRRLPRRRIPSLGGGVQLVLDRTPWMAPFADDVDALAARMRSVAGGSLDERSVADAVGWRWMPPPAGTAVVVVSELGRVAQAAGSRAPAAAWRAIVADVAGHGFAPIVVVPGRRRAVLPRGALAVDWDRATRVADISRFRKARAR